MEHDWRGQADRWQHENDTVYVLLLARLRLAMTPRADERETLRCALCHEQFERRLAEAGERQRLLCARCQVIMDYADRP